MKNIFKKAILPLLVFGIAIAGVFATNSSVVLDQPSQPVYTGFHYYQGLDEYDCIEITDVMNCTKVNTGVICTWEETPSTFHNLYAKEVDNDLYPCSIQLYKRTVSP